LIDARGSSSTRSMIVVFAPSLAGDSATSRSTPRSISRRVMKNGVDCTPPSEALPSSVESPPASEALFTFGTAATTSCALYSRFGMRISASAPAHAPRMQSSTRRQRRRNGV
jgi:hypothetical protein